ncbi:MAG: crossover junction endodeoxyribonuclease RuvC [Xanthomonadales bacterium]|nr:crossover junction endodeoxyribonuclease RuvC [Xanthomonadales bacterium]
MPDLRTLRILGVDPGSLRTGIGIVDLLPGGSLRHVHHETVRLAGERDFLERLRRILQSLEAAIDRHRPTEAAIERVFLARNPDAALKLGQARGAALCALVARAVPVHEYAPMQIKGAVVGAGAAEKHQVQHMVSRLLALPEPPESDAADALAVAITHAHARALAQRTGLPPARLLRRRGGRGLRLP